MSQIRINDKFYILNPDCNFIDIQEEIFTDDFKPIDEWSEDCLLNIFLTEEDAMIACTKIREILEEYSAKNKIKGT